MRIFSNILKRQYIRRRGRNHDITVQWKKEKRTFAKDLYDRTKERKGMHEMTNEATYELYGVAGLTV